MLELWIFDTAWLQGLLAGRLRELRSLREKGHSKEDEELDE